MSNNTEPVADVVRRIVHRECLLDNVRLSDITDDKTLDALEFDSLDRVELAISLETTYEKRGVVISLDDDAISAWATVADVVKTTAHAIEFGRLAPQKASE